MLIHFSSPHNVPGKPAQGNCMDYEQVIASICDDMQASVFRRTGRVEGLKGGLPEIIWALSLVQRRRLSKRRRLAPSSILSSSPSSFPSTLVLRKGQVTKAEKGWELRRIFPWFLCSLTRPVTAQHIFLPLMDDHLIPSLIAFQKQCKLMRAHTGSPQRARLSVNH